MNRLINTSVIVLLFFSLLLSGCGAISDPRAGDSGINSPGSIDMAGNGNEQDRTKELQNGDGGNIEPDSSKPDDSEPGDEPPRDADADIAARIKEMTLDEKIGQMFIVGFKGTEITQELHDMLETSTPGGVILFRSNIQTPEQMLELINSIKGINSGREPLFVCVDEEGGRVSRMPEALSDIPSAGSIGEYGDIQVAYDIG